LRRLSSVWEKIVPTLVGTKQCKSTWHLLWAHWKAHA